MGKNKWKAVAIAMIALFALFVVVGAIKAHHFRKPFTKPTESQIESAKGIAIKKLQSMGENASDYEVHVAERIRSFKMGRGSQNIIQVSFYSNMTTHLFIIDMDYNEAILHSKTEKYMEIERDGNPKHKAFRQKRDKI